MIALRLARLIERHADELAAELVVKFETSSHTAELRKVPVENCGDESRKSCGT